MKMLQNDPEFIQKILRLNADARAYLDEPIARGGGAMQL
jgi:hypothetical protein